ncbi:PAS domain-containing protein [Burkholderia pyrrocinia]|uniref:PAS domain-containing protein n=1 Tax=Burkholderia pyrrocinia TaxID=60550 RepID=UPI00158DD710|nr:PAS domain-containing protein [Burkholderia pyrrocinia]
MGDDSEDLLVFDVDQRGASTLIRHERFGRDREDTQEASRGWVLLDALCKNGTLKAWAGVTEGGGAACGTQEVRLPMPAGRPMLTVSWMAMPAPRHGAWRYFCVVRDVTGIRPREAFGFEQERELRAVIEHCPDPIVRYDREGRRLYANAAHADATGIPPMVGIRKTPRELGVFDEQTNSIYEDMLRRVMSTGCPSTVMVSMRCGGRDARRFSVRCVPELDAEGVVVGALAIARDMTDWVDADTRLRRLLYTIMEHALDWIAIYDAKLCCIHANQALQTFVEASLDGCVNWEEGALSEPTLFWRQLRESLDSGVDRQLETTLRSRLGPAGSSTVRISFHPCAAIDLGEAGTAGVVVVVRKIV